MWNIGDASAVTISLQEVSVKGQGTGDKDEQMLPSQEVIKTSEIKHEAIIQVFHKVSGNRHFELMGARLGH